ncbi:zinc-binding dehydrogenase [Agromyces mangrovi Wang et al. 2018]|uniref:zinc-binding dehydrogenase n=1 Tax=Agromyces mangrovi TaxID=1858653 RepID=UPI002572C33E|nr:zinc-binding dehydrogenase [Agromyces mangrovi]
MPTARAALVTAAGGGFSPAEIELDDPIGREVLVDVRAAGLCHTDLTMSHADLGIPLPAVFGHEVAGVVAAVGPDATGVAVGDHVVGCLVQHCGTCDRCRAGRATLCRQPGATLRDAEAPPRLTRDGAPLHQMVGIGGFAERVLVDERQLVVVSRELPFAQAALLGCGVLTGVGAVRNAARVRAGDAVAVIGAGCVGLSAIAAAAAAGADRIVAVDLVAEKLEAARLFGATHVVDSSVADDPVAAVRAATGGGADSVLDVVGVQATAEQGLAMTAPGGGLYVVGVMDPTARISPRLFGLISAQRRIQGVYMGAADPRRDIPEIARMARSGALDLGALVSAEVGLDDIDEGYRMLRDPNVVRVVVGF